MKRLIRKANEDLSELKVKSLSNKIEHTFDPSKKGVFYADARELAVELIAELPLVPTNEVILVVQDAINEGGYSDISTPEKAYDNWDLYVKRTVEILNKVGYVFLYPQGVNGFA